MNWVSTCTYDVKGVKWTLPDPAEQFSNPYLGIGNNPVMYVDPDGEFVHIVIGAVIGGTVNWITNGATFDSKGLGYFGVGALAGGLAAGIGAGVSSALVSGSGGSFAAGFAGTTAVSSTGFAAGAVTGAASGVTSGFITGTGNALVGGENIGQALDNGLNSAWKQGLSGAAVGGVIGGFQAKGQGKDFWTGATEENVTIYLEPDGTVNDDFSVNDMNSGPSSQNRLQSKQAIRVSNDNPAIQVRRTTESIYEYEVDIDLPQRLRVTKMHYERNNPAFIRSGSSNRGGISLGFVDTPGHIAIEGTKYYNRPIQSVGDLFNTNANQSWWFNRSFWNPYKW